MNLQKTELLIPKTPDQISLEELLVQAVEINSLVKIRSTINLYRSSDIIEAERSLNKEISTRVGQLAKNVSLRFGKKD